MKGVKGTRASALAALKQVKKDANTIATLAEQQLARFEGFRTAAMRGYANDLMQRVHEYNAYINVLEAGDKSKGDS